MHNEQELLLDYSAAIWVCGVLIKVMGIVDWTKSNKSKTGAAEAAGGD